MKHKIRLTVLLATAISTGSLRATDDFAQGDLALVFYSLSVPAPGNFGTEYYVFNLGSAAAFRENTQNNVSVTAVNPAIVSGNIADDLASVFGPSWAEDGTVRMMAVANVQAGQLANGDPSRTTYFSAPRSSLDSGQSGYDALTPFIYFQDNESANSIGSTLRGQISNELTGFLYTGTNGAINSSNAQTGTNVSGTRLTTSFVPNLSAYVPPATTTYFKLGINPAATLEVGVLTGTSDIEAAVDVFRVVNTLVDAELTSGSSSGDAVVGQGQFIGSITLDTSGNLKVQAVGAPTVTGDFASWAIDNNVTGGQTGDSDLDGVSNLLEYALNLNTAGSDGSVGSLVGMTMAFSKRAIAVSNDDITYAIQESDDLGFADAWQVVTPTTDTVSEITYTLPTGAARKFARIVVTEKP